MTNNISSLWRHLLRAAGFAGAAGAFALFTASAAQARSDIEPYLEVQQVFDAELGGGGEVFTYTSVAAGVDARVSTRRVDVQASYRYERRIDWNDELVDEDVHSGLVAARIEVAPEVLSIDAGAIAARSRLDSRGPAFGFNSADDPNIAQVYGVYAGPTVSTHAGSVAINAAYHIGYVKVDDHSLAGGGFPGGQLDRYESSVSHNATASVGMEPGELPVGWTVGAGYQREDTKRLDQRFEGKFVRGDVVVPVSPTFAVTAGVGYEKLEASQQDILRGPGGVPITTPAGNPIADPSKPRLLAYDQSGLIWDAGVIWRPSPRTEITVRGGQRYGNTTVVGTLKYQIGRDFAFSAVAYDSVSSFGRLLISDINGLNPGFKVNKHGPNAGVSGIGGCVFGQEPGSGGCLNDAFQSVSTANFRNRGIGLLLSGSRGVWDVQLGAGYARRKYLTPGTGIFSLEGVVDESITVEGTIGRRFTRSSGIDFDAYAAWFDTSIAGNGGVFSSGLTGTYYHNLLFDRLQAQASLGIYTTDAGADESTIASGMVGLRYTF